MVFEKTVRRVLHLGFLATRPMTLGVRVAAFDADGRVFLVRHTYVSGWYMPGGGVDPGETVEEAARREICEEGNLSALGGLTLVSVHFNNQDTKRDHVLLYRADGVVQSEPKTPDREIAEAGFFAMAELPEVTDATARRLDELCLQTPTSPYW